MITIKLKIQTSKENKVKIKKYQKQYSNLLHVYFNRYREGLTQTQCKHLWLNNTQLLDSWVRQSCIYEAAAMSSALDQSIKTYNQKMKIKQQLINKATKTKKQKRQLKKLQKLKYPKVLFGGKQNFKNRSTKLITKQQFLNNRLSNIYSIGEGNNKSVKGNRKFQIKDTNIVIFKPSVKEKYQLKLIYNSAKYKRYLQLLIEHQNNKDLSITYKLSTQFILISFNQTILKTQFKQYKPINNRILSIDLNPNYIGYSVVDWINSQKFNIIQTGTLSLKGLNDVQKKLKKQKLPSTDAKRLHLTNKRHFQVLQCSKFLIQKMKHFRCSIFSIEDLKIKAKDSNRGKRYNKLCINQWCRNILVNNLQKWCNIYNIKLVKVKPEYSSFVGNIIYRKYNLPDMILSSLQISRRGYEFYHQYIVKDKAVQKNIVWINLTSQIKTSILQSLEELRIESLNWQSLFDLYKSLKKSKCKYRVPLSQDKVLQLNSLKFQLIT